VIPENANAIAGIFPVGQEVKYCHEQDGNGLTEIYEIRTPDMVHRPDAPRWR